MAKDDMTAHSDLPGPDRHSQLFARCEFTVHLFGELRIAAEGQLLPLPPYRTHRLLAALLLTPRPQRRERLVGLLFPDMPEKTGRRRLSDLLWLLRRSLPQLPLETSAQEVCLPLESRWLDAEAFQQSAARETLDDWLAALALYRGDLLESVYDDWLLAEREMLYLQYLRLAHRSCDRLIQQGRFAEVLPLAEKMVQAEPYDEGALRTLMQAYRAVGRRGTALAAYERFVALVEDELGAEPEPASRTLAEAIRGGAAGTAAPHSHTSAAPLPSLDDPPELVLDHAQRALARGDRATVEACLQRLRADPICSELDACLLEVDLALFYEEFDRAAHLLDRCDAWQRSVLIRSAKLDLERRRAKEAQATAAKALVEAHEAGDRQSEVEALLVLAHAQRRLGQAVQAARSAEQALTLARARNSPVQIAQVLITVGHSQFRQGRYVQARSLYEEARSLAHEHGLLRIVAESLHLISFVQSYRGSLLESLSNAEEALAVWRDLAVPGREASTLQSMAYTLAQLGRTADALRALEQAHRLCEQLGEPVRLAVNEYHLADTLLYHDDALAPRAAAVIREALAIFQAHEQQGWVAAAWDTLGRALWLSEQHSEALHAFQEAYAGYEQSGELGFLPELLARQGLAHLSLDEPVEALHSTRGALMILAQGEVSDEAISEIYYARAMALTANGEGSQARDYLKRAYQQLLDVAAHLADEAARQTFFHHNPITRRLMKEVYARGIASAPELGVVRRQLPTSRSGRPVQVSWTVDAGPADAALKQAQGAIALRRARLARLLQEAEAQGATPSVADLAETLGVSKRTVQRDLQTHRQQR
jgi:DNA-binding SARP family transcriptional activator